MIKKFNNDDNFDKIISNGKWFVDFSATWCMPCKMLEPIMNELSNDFNVLKVDIDEFGELAYKYEVMSVPCVIVLDDGVEKKRIVGLNDIDVYKNNAK